MDDFHSLVKLSPMLSPAGSKSMISGAACLILLPFILALASYQNSAPAFLPPESRAAGGTPTPDVYSPYTIEALTRRKYGGGQLEIVDTLEINESFTRYLITYPSDGLTIYGFMNVPNDGSIFIDFFNRH